MSKTSRNLAQLFQHPTPCKLLLRKGISRFRLLPYSARLSIDAVERPAYAHCLYESAKLADRLGYSSISAIEFGVAGGAGLCCLETHAERIEKLTGVSIEIYGFDSGMGLPKPADYRDMPYLWQEGFYAMDEALLRSKLTRAKLIIGNVLDTVKQFFYAENPAPIGAVFHDLDFYSSTKASFDLFRQNPEFYLPRVFNYFDDIVGTPKQAYNSYTGERLAIREFNEQEESRKFDQAHYLLGKSDGQTWHSQIYILHLFDHALYREFVGLPNRQLPL